MYKVVYKLMYCSGKIYIGSDATDSQSYFGSPNDALLDVDYPQSNLELRDTMTVTKTILWRSATATNSEMLATEKALIIEYESNNPDVGYNRKPKYRGA